MKRVPLDNWSVREQLCLASAVLCSGDQNWMSVSRSLKMLCDSKRPPDWFSIKSCAAQYGKLLENVETPKRKKRTLSERDSLTPVETPGESIVKKLTQERIMELKQTMIGEQQEFQKLKDEILLIQSEEASDDQIRQIWSEIEEEERQKEIEKANHDEWLKKREQRKLEMERAWRPGLAFHGTKSPQKATQLKQPKVEENEVDEGSRSSGQSPLLTSLLKSPSTSTASSNLLQVQTTPTSSRAIPGNHPAISSSSTTFDPTNSSSLAPQIAPLSSSSSSSSQITSTTSASQQVPTLSMLLDTKNAHKVKNSTEPISTSTTVDSPQPDMVSEIFPEQISSVESGDARDDDQLMEVFKGLIPDNIEELADILTDDNNEIIPELLEEEILEKALIEGEESNPEPKLDAFDQLKNETIREERKKKELAAQQQLQQLELQLQQQQKEEKLDENLTINISPEDSNQEDDLPLRVIQKDILEANKAKEHQVDPLSVTPGPSSYNTTSDMDTSVTLTEETKETFTVVPAQLAEQTFYTPAPSTKNEEPAPDDQQGAAEPVSIMQTDTKTETTEEPMEIEFEEDKDLPDLIDIKQEFNESAIDSSTATDKKNQSDDEIFEDAKEEISNEPLPTQQSQQVLDTDEDSVTEALTKDDKSGGRTRRDYTRKQKHADEAQIRSEDSDSRSSSMVTRTRSKEHERSESPMIYDEDSDNTPRRTRRFSSTPVIDSVPGSPASGVDDKEHKAWRKLILLAYGRIAAHRHAEVFRILKDEDYERKHKKAVLKPVDLTSIKKNIENGTTRTTTEFQRNIMQLCTNIMMISPKNSSTYNQARDMMVESVTTIRFTMEEMKETTKEADRSTSVTLPATTHTTRKASRKSQRV